MAETTAPQNVKWATLAAIAILAAATALGWDWIWGLLFLYWAVMGAMAGEAFLIEAVTRRGHPVTFWIITAMWAAAGLWTLVTAIPSFNLA